jgi:1-acyl-sn-glycerol-3-phosphate acyltransferase
MVVWYPVLLLLMTVATLILAPTVILLALIGRGDDAYRPIRIWCRLLLALSGVRFRASGLDNVPRDRPYVVLSNHCSHFDGPTLILALPHPVYFIIKQELAAIPLWGPAVVSAGFIAVDRANSDRARQQMDSAAQTIAENRRVLVFPEGTRSSSDRLLPFKKGGSHLAIAARVPILPVAVNRGRRVLAKGQWIPTPGELEVRVGEPIETAGLHAEDVAYLTDRVRDVISELRSADPDFDPDQLVTPWYPGEGLDSRPQ